MLDTLDANGNTDELNWPGGKGVMVVTGTWGSGTAKLQATFDGGTIWLDWPSISLTANGVKEFTAPPTTLRVNLAGATGPALTLIVDGCEI